MPPPHLIIDKWLLAQSGMWHSLQIESAYDSITFSTVTETLHLASLSAIAPVPNSVSPKSQNEISILSLGSSFVLLAGITRSPTRELALFLWDLQYSVLLASHTMPIPSSLSQVDKGGLTLDLVSVSNTQATLVLTPGLSTKAKTAESSSLRSNVLVVPFTAPTSSTIANAIGRASDGAKWLVRHEVSPYHSDLDPTQTALLKSMRAMMDQNRPEAASTTFFEWALKEKQDVLNGKNGKEVFLVSLLRVWL